MAELKQALENLLNGDFGELQQGSKARWHEEWPEHKRVPEPIVVEQPGEAATIATIKVENGGDYLLFCDPQDPTKMMAVASQDAHIVAGVAGNEYRSMLSQGKLPQYKDLDEAGKIETQAMFDRVNMIKDAGVRVDGAIDVTAIASVKSVAEIEAVGIRIENFRPAVPEAPATIVADNGRAGRRRDRTRADEEVKPEVQEEPKEEAPKDDVGYVAGTLNIVSGADKMRFQITGDDGQVREVVTSGKEQLELSDGESRTFSKVIGEDGQADSYVVNTGHGFVLKSEAEIKNMSGDNIKALGEKLAQAAAAAKVEPAAGDAPDVDMEKLRGKVAESVEKLEYTLGTIADMRETMKEAGQPAIAEDYAKQALINGVYMMRSNFPSAVGKDGTIDVSKLPVQPGEELGQVITEYNKAIEATTNVPSEPPPALN